MDLINVVADDAARGYSASLTATPTSANSIKDTITGKDFARQCVGDVPGAER